MGKRQNSLAVLIKKTGIEVHFPIVVDRSIFNQSELHNDILEIYQSLGGILENYPIDFGNFDIVTENGFVELDEENHFNRYRKITLQSDLYKKNESFSVSSYSTYCETKENRAGKSVGFWTNDSSEEQFGKSSPARDFSGNGPARWKQRAFYDFLKDAYCVITNKQLFRVSIYDEINGHNINNILKKQKKTEDLVEYLLEALKPKPDTSK